MVLSLDDFERQMIGVLGWLDTPLQSHVYVVWFAILGFLVLAALAVGGARERLLLLGLSHCRPSCRSSSSGRLRPSSGSSGRAAISSR